MSNKQEYKKQKNKFRKRFLFELINLKMDKFKALVAPEVRDYVAATVVTVGGAWAVIKVGGMVVQWISKKRLE